jgi:HD superfamily phosphodiesterase
LYSHKGLFLYIEENMSTPENIRNKAYSAARQLVRNRLAENAGDVYEKLDPSDKINVDRIVETKQAHIKKIALQLIPKIAESYSNKKDMNEELNKKFASTIKTPEKKDEKKGGGKSPHIQMHNSFSEEVALDSAVYKAMAKKSEKSGVDITTLGEVYNRGMSTWYEDTNVSQQQYAFARVNSFINKGKTYFNEDNDLLAENFGDDYHVLYVNKKPATKYQFPGDAKKDMEYLSKKHPDVHLQLKKVTTTVSEATYQGREVPLNKPMKGDVKKSKVYVDPDGDGKAQKVNFGDKTLSIKKNNPDRKKSYCARSGGQGNLTDKTSANYWSRKAWNCEEVEIDDENTLELTQEEMNFFVENGVQFELVEATIRNTKKLIQRLHDREQGQTYGGNPYSSHPKAVMRLGIKVFGGKRFDQNARKAALLHDTIEDTPTSPETLSKKGFHPDVVKAVQLLSKDKTKSYEGNIENIASGKTPAHNYAKMVKYVDNMSNYMATPKPEWGQDRVEKQKGKYMNSMVRLGRELNVDHHTKLTPKWKMKTEEIDKSKPSNREEGTEKLTKIYKKDTPGQSGNLNEHFSMAFDYQGKPTLAPTAHDLMMKTQGGFAHHNDVQDVMNVKSIKEQIEKAFEATILEEDKNALAISMDSLIDMVNEAFETIANIRSSNIERDAWSQAQILKLERYIQSVAAYIENMDEVVRSGEAHGVVVPAHTIVSQKTGETISIPAKTKSVKTNKVVLHPNDNPFDGR